MSSSLIDHSRPNASLLAVFAAWKALLLAIAVGSGVGQPYDTSTTLVTAAPPVAGSEAPWDISAKLTRWDAIYFVQSARRGYVFEQERAFGPGPAWLIGNVVRVLELLGVDTSAANFEPLAGIAISHTSHLLSVLVLFQLGVTVTRNKGLSLTAAILHIISPAGLFLSAAYAESTFSFLSFVGYLFLAKGLLGRGGANHQYTFAHDASIISAGLWFGFSCLFRSNGLFSGIPFAVALLVELTTSPPTLASIRKRFAIIVGGSAIAIGFIAPQVFAYIEFCVRPVGEELRPWCRSALPSIYTFVQDHYWNVGFLRYWVPLNIPLFFLAAPVLYLLLGSGVDTLRSPAWLMTKASAAASNDNHGMWFLRSMAIAQVLIASLAITNFHVQIISRIASAYPLWYLWLAEKLSHKETAPFGGRMVKFMVLYATIQGVLFASFIPPA